MSQGPHQSSPSELRGRLAAERSGSAFAVLRDAGGEQRIVLLDANAGTLVLGRGPSADIQLAWDREVSRVHAELAYVGGQWTVTDNGLSRNGTYVNGERVSGRRRLHDGDQLTCGATLLLFRSPPVASEETSPSAAHTGPPLSDAHRRVALALCRDNDEPATNDEIAAELFLSVATVKTHLRALYQRFGLEELPQNAKRRRLVWLLKHTGALR